MAYKNTLKSQRDRFLAFSFASSDLLLEVAADDEIQFALGAGKSLTGVDHEELQGTNWLDLFDKKEKITLMMLRSKAVEGKRCGPIHVKLNETTANSKEAIVTGIKMPGSDVFYLTASFVTEVMAKLAGLEKKSRKEAPHDKETFIDAAQEALREAKEDNVEVDITLLDIAGSDDVKAKLGPELWSSFSESVQEMLNANSLGGQTASQISDGRYSILHDKNLTPEAIKDQLAELSKETDPDGEGIEFDSKTIPAEVAELTEREAARALIYTINEFERRGTDLNVDTLGAGFEQFVTENAQKIQRFKTMITQLNFQLYFQPIVDLKTYELVHFEMLSRFKDEGSSTQEWIMFGEDIGMAAEMDMAICERAINYLKFKAATNNFCFAINLSGQSIQNEQFFDALYAKLEPHKNLAKRLIFEITESNEIQELEKVNKFIKQLQGDGFKVCLDDFGAGSASFQYLHELHVNYLKIDGKYTQKILTSERDQVMIKNLSQMCKDLDTKVVIERIEYEEQAEAMRELGVGLGQGYFFSEPKPQPEYLAIQSPLTKKENT